MNSATRKRRSLADDQAADSTSSAKDCVATDGAVINPVSTRTERQPKYRFQIQYKEEALRERVHANTRSLVQAAQSRSDDSSTAVQLAKKALRYRKLLTRLQDVDLDDPNVDVTQHLGVRWQKMA
ncbi:TPA: hypothetical protein N0F65_002796 [Lagenidium giganteum]|uniref:Uncharacterized protein n=1 Tax=Lagenidium giganteum TaxID=4803 RepID=A0AAV2YJ98_9STRA|nr:TPA: hypothetical protein N0F65_002796 [Lagenidium giganteum]